MILTELNSDDLGFMQVLLKWLEVLIDTSQPDHVTKWLKEQEQCHNSSIAILQAKALLMSHAMEKTELEKVPAPSPNSLWMREIALQLAEISAKLPEVLDSVSDVYCMLADAEDARESQERRKKKMDENPPPISSTTRD
jgi:hypothetical protein